MMLKWAVLAMGAMAAATPALAQEDEPRFCPNRPSLESSACVTEPGRVHFELSVADWELDNNSDERSDTILGGDFQVRAGVGPTTELQLEWSPLGYARTRAKGEGAGSVERVARVGDVRLAVRQNLRNPDGKGLSFGFEPFVTVPVGRRPVGMGSWGAGVVLPVTYDLTETVNIGFTGELDAAPDSEARGRHLQASGVVATSINVTESLSATIEAQLIQDNDPSEHQTQALAGLGLQWRVRQLRALYAEAVAGLNHNSPDIRLYAGMAALF